MYVPKALDPVTSREDIGNFRKPVSGFPEAGKDEIHPYMLGIKHDAPFEWFDLACGAFSLHFQKFVVPPEASYVENQRKHYPGGWPLANLTDRQADFIRGLFAERKITIPRQQNPDYKGPESDGPEFLPAYDLQVADSLAFMRLKDYNPVLEYYRAQDAPVIELDEGQKLHDAVYDAQKSSRGKKN